MNSQQNSHYAQTQGILLLEKAAQELGPIFTIKQLEPIASGLRMKPTQLRWVISRLAQSGWIEMLKKGTYAVKSPLFGSEISPFAIAAALIQPMAISHWSALAYHGFTTQLVTMVQASTPHQVLTPEMRSGRANSPRGRAIWRALDVDIEYIHIQARHFFGHQLIWVNSWNQVAITDPERTALDLVARSDIFGGMDAAIDLLEETLPKINPDKLIHYGLQYESGAVIKRLGWILDHLNVNHEMINALQNYSVKTYYRLEPKNPPSKNYNARWQVIENLKRVDA